MGLTPECFWETCTWLSCRSSHEGRHQRHGELNEIVHRSLTSAHCHVPSQLEPVGLLRSDVKLPEGVTTVPWKCRKLINDACCILNLDTVEDLNKFCYPIS